MSEKKEKTPDQRLLDVAEDKKLKKGGPKKFGSGIDPAVGKATQIKKGQRLKGAGRPKRKLMTDALLKVGAQRVPRRQIEALNVKGAGLRYGITWAEMAALGMFKRGAEGVVENFNTVADRTDGPVRQEISGPEGGPIAFTEDVNVHDKLRSVTGLLRDRASKRRDAQAT